MSFLEKYLIVSKLEASETMSFQAQDTWTGQPVLLHQLLPGGTAPHQPDLAMLVFKYLPGAGTPGTEHFLEMGEEDDRVFIVTADVPECLDLRKWLQSIAASQANRETLAGPSPAEPGSTPTFIGSSPDILPEHLASTSEASNLSSPQPDGSQPAAPHPWEKPTVVVAPPSSRPPEPQESKHQPGDFTRMFNASGGATEPPDNPPRGQVPGGFEVVFQSRKQPSRAGSHLEPPGPATVPPPPSPVTAGPGKFTQMFASMSKDKAEQPLASPPPPSPGLTQPSAPPPALTAEETRTLPASQSDSRGPGEFTQSFKTGGEPMGETRSPGYASPSQPPAPLPGAAKKGPGELTQLMQGYKSPTATPAAQALELPTPASPPPAAAPGKRAPGEFTMLFQHPPQPTAPVPPAGAPPPVAQPAPPPPQTRKPGTYTSLFETPQIPPTPPPGAPPAVPPAGYAYPAVPVAPPPPPAMPQMPAYKAPPPPAAPKVAYPQVAMPQPPQCQPPPPPAMPQMQPMAMPPPPAPQAMPPGTKKPGNFLVLLLVLGGLFLVAVALILFFALKH